MGDVAFERACFLREAKLADFWDFASSVRSRSLGLRESQRLRGAWLAEHLAVQKVHGYSLYAVRIVCVVAEDAQHRQRLQDFFTRDERNMRVRFRPAADPLDQERRVLVKVPYDSSLDGWVEHEWQVLDSLRGIEGVPRLFGQPFFFEDLGIRAIALEFSGMPSLQELQSVRPVVEIYRAAQFFLATLEQVHQRGWVHADLQPKDLLIFDPSVGGSVRQAQEALPSGLICGWSRAMRKDDRADVHVQQLPSLLAQPRLSTTWLVEPSVFSAPEQYVTLYTGQAVETPSTDLFRLAAVAAQALHGAQFRAAEPGGAATRLRRLCHCALLRGEDPADASEQHLFLETYQELAAASLALGDQGLDPWLRRMLAPPGAAPPEGRFGSAEEALSALQEAWPDTEAQLLVRCFEPERLPQPREPLVLETPPLLAEMHVL